MFVDEATINVKAGNGGAGKVAFNKIPKMLGPTGGNGGHGGAVFVVGVSDLSALKKYRFEKKFTAGHGEAGGINNRSGAQGAQITLEVPVGTIIHNLTLGQDIEVLVPGEPIMIAHGGQGGKGNFMFRSALNTSPTESQPGLPGQEYELRLELKLIADAGLIGLPNAGKSSLLNALTRASAKVANYPFTTLEPNLGALFPAEVLKASDVEQAKAKAIILADIPGLIEGASLGKGLGIKFLRHVSRTQYLLHCISSESTDLKGDYAIIRSELGAHDPSLLEKSECILLTKTDLISEDEVKERMKVLKKLNKKVIPVSIQNKNSLEALKAFLEKELISERR
ncbi:MAG: GTPase ObgE [bacterium]|nr:GTPase ObgE [bacterium]